MKEKILPQNIEAEKALLASIFIDAHVLDEVAGEMSALDFYRDAHRTVYEVMITLHRNGVPVDLITVIDELERLDKLEEVGGMFYITGLTNDLPTSANAVSYARVITRCALARKLCQVGAQIVQMAYEQDTQMLEKAQSLIIALSEHRRTGKTEIKSMYIVMNEYLEKLNQLSEQKERITGVPTGFTDLDRMTGGLQRSDLVIIAGRPGMGKSALAMEIAVNAAKSTKKCRGIIFSLEMSLLQLTQRVVSTQSGIENQRLRTGDVNDTDWEQLLLSVDRLSELPLWLADISEVSIALIQSVILRHIAIHGQIDFIVVDYLQLIGAIADDGERRTENRVQFVGEIARGLKLLAMKFNIVVIALAQLSRAVEGRQNKRPQKSDLKESGGIEENADVVGLLYREAYYNPECEDEKKHICELIIDKHRNGPIGDIELYFDPSLTRFRDLEKVQ